MSIHLHSLARWRIRTLFTRGIPAWSHRRLVRDLADCARCAALYRDYARAEAAMCSPGSTQASVFALERTQAAIFDRVGSGPERRSGPRRRWVWAAPPALVATSALVVFALLREDEPSRFRLPPDARLATAELVARGPEASANADIGIRMLRVLPDAAVAEGGAVSIGEAITFTYTDVRPGTGYLALFGVQRDGRVRWYYPGEGECCSVRVRSDVVDEPLGDGFVLSRRYAPGWLRVTALFSARPIDKRDVEQAVRRLEAQSDALEHLAPVPLDGLEVREYSIRVEIAESPRG